MKGLRFRNATSDPLTAPIPAAASSAMKTTSQTGRSARKASVATMPVIVMTAIGVRSSPPLITTTVAKAAAIPTTDTASVMFRMFFQRQKNSEAKPR